VKVQLEIGNSETLGGVGRKPPISLHRKTRLICGTDPP
jgi:hypothetical protein